MHQWRHLSVDSLTCHLRRSEQLAVVRQLPQAMNQFCFPLPAARPPYVKSTWLANDNTFYQIDLVKAPVRSSKFVTPTSMLQAGHRVNATICISCDHW